MTSRVIPSVARGVIPSAARNLQFALLLFAIPAYAQTGVQLQGILNGEFWSTDTMSTFLRRNGGSPGVLECLMLWGALEPKRGIVVYAMGESERGPASAEHHEDLDMLGVRYTPSSHLVMDAGKFPQLLGAFSARRFSTRNPLIGEPDTYPTEYPDGVKISGIAKWFDYRAGVVDLPVYHPDYTPRPTRAWRPAIAVGVTPYVGFRIGASYTRGPYLNDTLPASAYANRDWKDYQQWVAGGELSASIGYLELNGELARSSYEVPTHAKPVLGFAYYGDAKYTITPRLFVATRLERNDYPFVANFGGFWVGTRTDFHNEEFGAGFRLTASTILKASYRRDHWHVNGGNSQFIRPGGQALAVQLSQAYDVIDWIDRLRWGGR
jgi:hypothetical protein